MYNPHNSFAGGSFITDTGGRLFKAKKRAEEEEQRQRQARMYQDTDRRVDALEKRIKKLETELETRAVQKDMEDKFTELVEAVEKLNEKLEATIDELRNNPGAALKEAEKEFDDKVYRKPVPDLSEEKQGDCIAY